MMSCPVQLNVRLTLNYVALDYRLATPTQPTPAKLRDLLAFVREVYLTSAQRGHAPQACPASRPERQPSHSRSNSFTQEKEVMFGALKKSSVLGVCGLLALAFLAAPGAAAAPTSGAITPLQGERPVCECAACRSSRCWNQRRDDRLARSGRQYIGGRFLLGDAGSDDA